MRSRHPSFFTDSHNSILEVKRRRVNITDSQDCGKYYGRFARCYWYRPESSCALAAKEGILEEKEHSLRNSPDRRSIFVS